MSRLGQQACLVGALGCGWSVVFITYEIPHAGRGLRHLGDKIASSLKRLFSIARNLSVFVESVFELNGCSDSDKVANEGVVTFQSRFLELSDMPNNPSGVDDGILIGLLEERHRYNG